MRFVRKRKICYISNFVNLKYLIHENVLTFLIGLLVHSLLLIIFRGPKPRQRVILESTEMKVENFFELIFVGKT